MNNKVFLGGAQVIISKAKKESEILTQEIKKLVLEYKKLEDEHNLDIAIEAADIRSLELERKMDSIQPKLIEAMITVGGVETSRILAENIKQQGGDWTELFRKGGVEGLLDTVKGTPLFEQLSSLLKDA